MEIRCNPHVITPRFSCCFFLLLFLTSECFGVTRTRSALATARGVLRAGDFSGGEAMGAAVESL